MAKSSTHGVRYLGLATIDDNGSLLKGQLGLSENGIYIIDGKGEGTITANITGLEQAGTPVYANNQVKLIQHGKQQPQVALTVLNMNNDVLNKIKGYVSDGKGGYVLSSGDKPNVALLLCSEDVDGTLIYEGFSHGEVTETGRNHETDNNNLTRADATLTFQALEPLKADIFMDDKGVQQPYKVWADDEPGFDLNLMYKEVFGGFSDVQSLRIPKKFKTTTVTQTSASSTSVTAQ